MRFVIKIRTSVPRSLLRAGVLVLFLLTTNAFGAISLDDYNKNLKVAYGLAENLAAYDEEVFEADDRDANHEEDILAAIKAAVPPTQTVAFDGFEIEADNRWIELTATAYLSESEDFDARRQYIIGMKERFGAISARVEQLLGPRMAGRSKDEDKNRLAEILTRPDFQKPEEKSESFFGRIGRQIKEWFNQKFPQPDVPKGAEEGVRAVSLGLQIVLYVLVGILVIFLIWRFGPYVLARVRGRGEKTTGDRVILGEVLSADENSNSLFDEAEALARSGNLRAAIRKGYIAFLCELSDRRVIGLAQHKTNRDYLRDVRKKRELYERMNGLTNSFERHWYGLDDADEQAWNEFRETYRQTLRSEF